MRDALFDIVRDPGTGDKLELAVFDEVLGSNGERDVREGILFSADGSHVYPLIDGVPVLLDSAIPADFLTRHADKISSDDRLSGLRLTAGTLPVDSFSTEWDEHFDTDTERTWGYTVQERVEQFFMEAQVTPEEIKGMMILDAGCGNGALTKKLADLGATVVGLDFSSSVYGAEQRKSGSNVHYVRGNMASSMIAPESFDLAISIGVMHHTPSTRNAFDSVAKWIKPEGKFYFWLYRKPENFIGRCIKVPIYDTMRHIVCRLPEKPQKTIVHAYARLVSGFHKILGNKAEIPFSEYVVAAYDDLACRWRYYHTPIETARWLHEAGFAAPVISHWDNPYGFGVVAKKVPAEGTPGINYGTGVKLWDSDRSVLGRLHKDK